MLTSSSSTFLSHLRARTATAHKNLENNRISRELLRDNVSPLNYASYLSKLFGIVEGFEKTVFPVLTNVITDLQRRKKAKLAIEDLKVVVADEHLLETLPICVFPMMDVHSALGAMYVMEGSTLGNRFLFKHIKDKLGLTERYGASYFFGYGNETMVMWNDFISIVEKEAPETWQQEKLIGSALTTYQMIDTWLSMPDTR